MNFPEILTREEIKSLLNEIKLLKEAADDLKADNDKWEAMQDGSTDVLRSSNDGATSNGSKQIHKGDKQDGSL